MLVKLVAVGSSRGVRIPSSIVKALGTDTLEMEFNEQQKTLILRAKVDPRAGWETALESDKTPAEAPLLNGLVVTPTMEEEWTW